MNDKIICGDNVKVLKSFEDENIDLVITSPPYDKLRKNKDYKETFDFENIVKQLYRVLKKGGVVVWVVNDGYIKGSRSLTSFKQAIFFNEMGFNVHDCMIYYRWSRFPNKVRYFQNYEFMFIFSKGRPKTIHLIRDRSNNRGGEVCRWGKHLVRSKTGKQVIGWETNNKNKINIYGIRENIWMYNSGGGFNTKDKIAYQHPAIFPEALVRDHIYSWSNEGDVILDIFNGSGTTTKMAYIMNRRYIGIEISQKYCDIAKERIKLIKDRNREYLRILDELNPHEKKYSLNKFMV